MEKQDIKQFTEIMMGLAENYPGAVLTSNGLKLRFAALKEFPIEQVSGAAVKLIKTHKYNSMPTVGDMINAMGGGQDKAEIEAGKILDHLHRFGAHKTPAFEDPVTAYLMGGRWRYFSWASRVQESELKWWTKDFIRAYQAHAGDARTGFCLPVHSEVYRLGRTIGQFVEKKYMNTNLANQG